MASAVYEFKYKPQGEEDKKTFLLGTSVGGSLNFYLYNNFSDDSVDLSFKCQNYTLETATSLSTMALRASGTMELTSSSTMGLTSSSTMELTSSSTMTLSAEKVQASTNKIGTQFSFTSTASASEYAWIGAAEFGKSQEACVNLGTVYNIKTKKYEPWISGYNSSGSMSNLYIVPGVNSFVYLGNPSSSKGAVARIDSSKLQINIGTREKPNWKEVAVKDDIPTPLYKYHIYAVFLNGDTDPSAYSLTNKYVFFTNIYTTKDPKTITTKTIYSDLLSKMIWGTPMLRYNKPDWTSPYTDKTSGVLWNFDDSYTTSAGGHDYTGPAFTFKGLGDEDSETRINPTVVEIKYEKVRVN